MPDQQVDRAAVTADLLDFFADRLKVHLRTEGVRHDLVSAVFATGQDDDLIRLLARVDALRDFLATDDGANLLVAHRRASNIVRIEEKRDGRAYAGAPDSERLEQDEEQALFARLASVGDEIEARLGARGVHRGDGGAGPPAPAGGCLLRSGHGQCRRSRAA